ncbi:lytic transglycosylase domain-containing protein [Paracoccus sp. p4-l81]|uniref:lytic transglycosylase domain-containing protein n=1 Tax=Paracoccus sp. p4-l81 TaxID=3342806 RepID=UPI0035BB045B
MRLPRLAQAVMRLALLVAIALPAQALQPLETDSRVLAPPPARAERRCSGDGHSCITLGAFIPDTCRAIETHARLNALDPHFFARLLWRESRFDPGAISPAGALGIAQFMPGTARIVGLDDPMNPAEAIRFSAAYLSRLRDRFGNLGLAAVAYNGGEDRAARFIAKGGRLPYETQDYVLAITGFTAEDWRESPPAKVDLRLSKTDSFHQACVTLAAKRRITEFATPERVWPWGAIVATSTSRAGAQRQADRMLSRLQPILGGKTVSYHRLKLRGRGRYMHTAQVGWDDRSDAYAFCQLLRARGGACMVLKN